MSRILYFDCFSGISGDMALGAMLDAGLPLDDLKGALGSLAVSGFDVSAARAPGTVDEVRRARAPSTRARATRHRHRAPTQPSARDLQADRSVGAVGGRSRPREGDVPAAGRGRGRNPPDAGGEGAHLHEVGALDSIIDIVGIVFALEWAGADRIVCSPLNVGGGMVQSAHGLFPVPAPATVKLLGDAPVYAGAVQKELVTPTGALIVTSYAGSFGPVPAMRIERVGYGAGERDDPTTPNVLRVLIGRAAAEARTERVTVVECEIDDMNPQIFGVVMDQLYAAGALEVFYVPVQMKKNRPGTLLTVIVAPERLGADFRHHLPRDDDHRAAALRGRA